MIRLVIADDHPIVREGLKRMLHKARDIEIAGEAATGGEVIDRCAESAPDVLVLDVSMPGPGFLEVLHAVRETRPDLRVLMLSVHPEESYALRALRALRAGASGYLTKERSPDELETAIRRVHAGERYVSDSFAQHLAELLGSGRGKAAHEKLSNREFEIFRRLGAGQTATAIASELHLSVKTVSTYRARIFEKTGLRDNAEIVHYTIEHGLV